MILPDSSIWIGHIAQAIPALNALLAGDRILGHPFVTGEIALGSLATRARTIAKLAVLPQLPVQHHERVAFLIESAELWSKGVGYVDAHLLASVRLVPGATLWTRDERLHAQAERLGVAYAP